MLSPVVAGALRAAIDYQGSVNGLLRAAGYHSHEFGVLSRADLDRMDAARAAGQTPTEFAVTVLAAVQP